MKDHGKGRIVTAAVTVDRSTNVVFRNCRFEHLGSYAVKAGFRPFDPTSAGRIPR